MVIVEAKEQLVFSVTMLGGDEKIAIKLCKAGVELDTTEQLRRCCTAGNVGERIRSKRCKTGKTCLEAT
jgi:hypothetical protein